MIKRFYFSVFISLISCYLLAIPARPIAQYVTQPDGSTKAVYLHGNELFHWFTDEAGNTLEEQPDGSFIIGEQLTDEVISMRFAEAQERLQKRRISQAVAVETPLNIAPRGLIILVNFSDLAFRTASSEIENMINGDNYTRSYSYSYYGYRYNIESSGSARQYFIDQSMGQYQPQFDVVGPYTVSNKMSYYGANNYYGSDSRPNEMVAEACRLASADGIDFSQYDNNGDGAVDFVYVIYAGFGEADGGGSSTIWPHSSDIRYYQDVRVNGKQVGKYACGSEMSNISKYYDGIGTFCHEFSHVLGLPDLYATNNATHKTLGSWDILDAGPYNNDGNTPPAYSAYERFFMGWLTPKVLNSPMHISLEELQKSNKAYIITSTGESNLIGNDPYPTEFFILENRQQKAWDEYLPGHGLLITKVQYSASRWAQNSVNNTASNMGVDIIEADGSAPRFSAAKATDAFPAGADEYTPYDDYPITNIEEKVRVVSFDFMGGEPLYQVVIDKAMKDAAAKKQSVEYTVIEAVYDFKGNLIANIGEDVQLQDIDLPAGMYIFRVSNGSSGQDRKEAGVKLRIMTAK